MPDTEWTVIDHAVEFPPFNSAEDLYSTAQSRASRCCRYSNDWVNWHEFLIPDIETSADDYYYLATLIASRNGLSIADIFTALHMAMEGELNPANMLNRACMAIVDAVEEFGMDLASYAAYSRESDRLYQFMAGDLTSTEIRYDIDLGIEPSAELDDFLDSFKILQSAT